MAQGAHTSKYSTLAGFTRGGRLETVFEQVSKKPDETSNEKKRIWKTKKYTHLISR